MDALRWSLHTARALQYLHESRPVIMHRDLKLDNIMLSSADVARADVKLADFGLARHTAHAPLPSKAPAPLVELTCNACPPAQPEPGASRRGGSTRGATPHHVPVLTGRTGSLGYMAPEVLASRPYGPSADIFSLGMCM